MTDKLKDLKNDLKHQLETIGELDWNYFIETANKAKEESDKINDDDDCWYVWFNIVTGEFSNPWKFDLMKRVDITIETVIGSYKELPQYKLIKFQCLNDQEFFFHDKTRGINEHTSKL